MLPPEARREPLHDHARALAARDALLILAAACAPAEPAGDATVPVGPEGLEGDL